MRRFLVLGLWVAGCADIRVPIAYVDGHLKEIKRAMRVEGMAPQVERELVEFHVGHSIAWTEAMLEHKGAAPELIHVPAGAYDTRTIVREDMAMNTYKAEVAQEKAIRAAASGWFGKVLGGGAATGGLGLMGILGLLWRKVKEKQAALAEYDKAVETLPKAKRIELGEKLPAMSAAHDAMNGG